MMRELSSMTEIKSPENNSSPEKSRYNDSERPTENSFQPKNFKMTDFREPYKDSERSDSSNLQPRGGDVTESNGEIKNSEQSKLFDVDKSFLDSDKKVDMNQKQDVTVSNKYDVDNRIEKPEKEVLGGSYSEVKKNSNGETHEVHHMPADSASMLERCDGPAIKMEKDDHKQTASYGASKEAREYQAAQKNLVDNGKFREAIQMDIDDIKDKFGSKYDQAISEMCDYVDKLEMEGKV